MEPVWPTQELLLIEMCDYLSDNSIFKYQLFSQQGNPPDVAVIRRGKAAIYTVLFTSQSSSTNNVQ